MSIIRLIYVMYIDRQIDFENINDNTQFWEKVSFSDKNSQCSQINLVDHEKLKSDDKGLSKEFSNLFDFIKRIQ